MTSVKVQMALVQFLNRQMARHAASGTAAAPAAKSSVAYLPMTRLQVHRLARLREFESGRSVEAVGCCRRRHYSEPARALLPGPSGPCPRPIRILKSHLGHSRAQSREWPRLWWRKVRRNSAVKLGPERPLRPCSLARLRPPLLRPVVASREFQEGPARWSGARQADLVSFVGCQLAVPSRSSNRPEGLAGPVPVPGLAAGPPRRPPQVKRPCLKA